MTSNFKIETDTALWSIEYQAEIVRYRVKRLVSEITIFPHVLQRLLIFSLLPRFHILVFAGCESVKESENV